MQRSPKRRILKRLPNEQIRDAAEQYYRACEVLAKHQLDPELAYDPGVYLPLLNVAAVALELYLKCLGAEEYYPVEDSPVPGGIERGPAKAVRKTGHEPAILLGEIPDSIQSWLVAAFKASALSQQADSFKDLLDQYQKLFEYSRYAYEEERHADYSPLEILQLLRFLREFVQSLPPSAWITEPAEMP